jgi:hypothetical protein
MTFRKKIAPALRQLVREVAGNIASGDEEEAIAKLSADKPGFTESEYLDSMVIEAWPALSLDARLVACLWAAQACDDAQGRIERGER